MSKDRLSFEREARAAGQRLIAGVDEVGNAAWAGPMVAAAVILPEDFETTGLRDGKKKSPTSRLAAYERIKAGALAIGIAQVSPEEIDRGFHAAHMRLLREAVVALPLAPDVVLVDHYEIPDLNLPQKCVPSGDDASASIAAASIVAKVECDRIMEAADAEYPAYGFRGNKGYPGSDGSRHRTALEQFGPSEIHRRSVRPVKEWLMRHSETDGSTPAPTRRIDADIAVPAPGGPWYPDVVTFALSYNAYERDGDFDAVASKANRLREAWEMGHPLSGEIRTLRSALFFEQRRWRHFDAEPAGRDRQYIDTILVAIAELSGGAVPGPADPFP